MKLGIALPHIGPHAGPDAILAVAQRAESLGFDSLWVLDRLFWPLRPAAKYPGSPRGDLPAVMQTVYEPLSVLSFVAGHTRRIALGTSVLVAAYRSPVLAAKIAATVDRLSQGRFIMGLGSGWSTDEFHASSQRIEERDARTDEFIEVVRRLWKTGESAFEGRYYRVPPAVFLPKPVRESGPPIWIGGNSARAIRRAAELGDGWHPTSRMKPEELTREMGRLKRLAAQAGRDPDRIELSLRWNNLPSLTDKDQIDSMAGRIRDYRTAGVKHICFDPNIPQPRALTETLEMMAWLKEQFA